MGTFSSTNAPRMKPAVRGKDSRMERKVENNPGGAK